MTRIATGGETVETQQQVVPVWSGECDAAVQLRAPKAREGGAEPVGGRLDGDNRCADCRVIRQIGRASCRERVCSTV